MKKISPRILFTTMLLTLLLSGKGIAAAEKPKGQTSLKGAKYLVDEIKKETAVAEKSTDTAKSWDQEWKEFQAALPKLSDTEAVPKWLHLYDRSSAEFPTLPESSPDALLKKFIQVLPGPSAWDLLDAEVKKRSQTKNSMDMPLRYLNSFLQKDAPGMSAALDELNEESGKNIFISKALNNISVQENIKKLKEALLDIAGSPEQQIDRFVQKLKEKNRTVSKWPEYVIIPDLVAMLGPEKARALLEETLVLPGFVFGVRNGEETRALASQVAQELIDKLPTPQWRLACRFDSLALYEALDQKFPLPQKNSPHGNPAASTGKTPGQGIAAEADSVLIFTTADRIQAEFFYILNLVIEHRSAEAAAVVKQFNYVGFDYLANTILTYLNKFGYEKEIQQFLYAVLKDNPTLDLWEYYIPLSIEIGEGEGMLALVNEVRKSQPLKPEDKSILDVRLLQAYLAMDRLDEARRVADEMVVQIPEKENPSGKRRILIAGLTNLAQKMCETGRLLEKNDWVDKGLSLFKKITPGCPLQDAQCNQVRLRLADELIELQRYAEAEGLLISSTLETIAAGNRKENFQDRGKSFRGYPQRLVRVYSKMDRPRDIVTLLDAFPYWPARDVKELIDEDRSKENMGYLIAQAFYKTGKREKAEQIAEAVIQRNPNHDPSYALLMEIKGKNFIPWLDHVYERNAFEERPLIWKAVVLAKEKKFDQAETAARQAIAVDPSDGDQPIDQRMKAYEIMAQIKKSKKEKDEAENFQRIVSAIRLAERGDQFRAAGLAKRASGMYDEALQMFSDAYCIQSRIAVELESLGDEENAEQHFLKAFALMPDSFGRKESHCFGCETIFATQHRQALAERVFLSLLKTRPQEPRVRYLLGALRLEEGNGKEAFEYFKQAVAMDPFYINAWKKFLRIASDIYFPVEERDEINLNLLKLDPDSQNVDVDLKSIWNVKMLAGIWAETHPTQDSRPTALYPLAAAQRELPPKDGGNVFVQPSDASFNQILRDHRLIELFSNFLTSMSKISKSEGL